jgi:hypothetical protein
MQQNLEDSHIFEIELDGPKALVIKDNYQP